MQAKVAVGTVGYSKKWHTEVALLGTVRYLEQWHVCESYSLVGRSGVILNDDISIEVAHVGVARLWL